MKKTYLIAFLLTLNFGLSTSSHAIQIGSAAPDFHVTDTEGKPESISQFKGKYIVLEWHNPECPYVKKHYETGNMQKLQEEWTKKGVIWFSINSSAKGKKGFTNIESAKKDVKDHNARPSATLLDTNAEIAKLYGAKTTPHMIMINPKGIVVYNGAIDDHPGTDADEVASAKNYVAMALAESMAGKKVSKASTTPYGCSIKY